MYFKYREYRDSLNRNSIRPFLRKWSRWMLISWWIVTFPPFLLLNSFMNIIAATDEFITAMYFGVKGGYHLFDSRSFRKWPRWALTSYWVIIFPPYLLVNSFINILDTTNEFIADCRDLMNIDKHDPETKR